MRIYLTALAGILFAIAPSANLAHEFWIDPEKYQIQSGAKIKAHLRVGEEFSGTSYPYRPSQITRFHVAYNDVVQEISARIGDVPALDMVAPAEGLVILVHETTDSRLTYTDFAKFKKFVAHKAFPNILAKHKARGIGEKKFVETYRRYAKSLVGVGHAQGSDSPQGLRTEIVALANPYTSDSTKLPVEVLLDGAARINAQVELFERSPGGDVTVTLHRTDQKGRAQLPVKAGFSYLVDAVWAEALPNDDPTAGPVWKTHWASLSFAVPAK